MALNRLYFITMDRAPIGPLEQVEAACRAGIRLIQLRMKEASDAEFLRVAEQAVEICGEWGSMLIVNDRVEIAAEVGAHGVHVGQEDCTVREARRVMGAGKIVGGTANTVEEIREHYRGGADYVGLGPYRFTTTKKKLSPSLGLGGYQRVMGQLEAEGISIPVMAIGGIGVKDVEELLDAGVYGVAFSGLLIHSGSWEVTVRILEESIKII